MPETTEKTIERFWQELASQPVVMLSLREQDAGAEPMTATFDAISQALDRFYVFTRRDNRLVEGLARNASAAAQYMSSHHDLYASLRGQLTLVDDETTIDRFWSDSVKKWYEGGRVDPAIALLEFTIEDLELWSVDMTLRGKFKLVCGGGVAPKDVRGEHVRATS